MKKKFQYLCFSIKLFFNPIYFRSSCGKKGQNRQKHNQSSQKHFFGWIQFCHSQLFAANHLPVPNTKLIALRPQASSKANLGDSLAIASYLNRSGAGWGVLGRRPRA